MTSLSLVTDQFWFYYDQDKLTVMINGDILDFSKNEIKMIHYACKEYLREYKEITHGN